MSEGASNGSPGNALSAAAAIWSAREVVVELTGRQPEGISRLNRTDGGGWEVGVDVVELTRVPSSTDLLATYEIRLDGEGSLLDMERTRRYTRNQVDKE
ncbi:MAG TPA: gas vesicle protein [Actinomycetota bacterium]|nr:gas vesicle protein [Actinomycetota bacterium]